MTPRETIYAAVFALARATSGIKSGGRRLKHWGEVSPADQPAIFMVQRTETADVSTKIPTKWSLRVDLVLYGHNSGQPNVAPMTSLNPIIDAIVASINPPEAGFPEEQTLGGLVTRCRVDGDILTDEGQLGDQAVVVIPVTIFTPN